MQRTALYAHPQRITKKVYRKNWINHLNSDVLFAKNLTFSYKIPIIWKIRIYSSKEKKKKLQKERCKQCNVSDMRIWEYLFKLVSDLLLASLSFSHKIEFFFNFVAVCWVARNLDLSPYFIAYLSTILHPHSNLMYDLCVYLRYGCSYTHLQIHFGENIFYSISRKRTNKNWRGKVQCAYEWFVMPWALFRYVRNPS